MRGILNRIRKINNLALDDPKAWNPSIWNMAGSQSLSGETVTEETALTYSAVWNAITLISGTVGSLPLNLMESVEDKKNIAYDENLYYLMHDSPNPMMTAMAFREAIQAHLLTWGNGYAEKVRNRMGEIVELWPIAPNRVLNIKYMDGKLWYEIKLDKENKWMSSDNILHIPGLGFDGFVGYSPISMARRSIGLSMALETFGSLYFGQGTHPGVIVSHPNKLGTEGHSNLKKSLTDVYSGLGKSHRLMLLEDGMTIEKIGIPPDDSQFLESRQFQIPEVARWFNLPPHKLKDLTKSSFNNIESEQISFVTDSILPWLIRLEQNYNMQLLTKKQRRQEKLYFNHVVEGLLRANAEGRAKLYTAMFLVGGMSPDDIRAKEDMNPIVDESKYFVPMNTQTLENARKQKPQLTTTPNVETVQAEPEGTEDAN